MLKEKVKEPIYISPYKEVTVTTAGNVSTIRYSMYKPTPATKKVSKDEYIKINGSHENTAGEVYNFVHTTTRAENVKNVRLSLAKLRDIINANATEPENVLWITLTYKENMRDTKRLYDDFRKFNMRLHTYCEQNNLSKYEYVIAAEPQARGAWHIHGLFIFNEKPYIPKRDLERVWGHGFVSIKRPDRVDNLGLYLTAYLCDMELSQVDDIRKIKPQNIKECEDRGGKSKAVIKGERLKLYPVGFRIFRTSKGIKRPVVEEKTYKDALTELRKHTLVYEKAVMLIDENEDKAINIFKYEQYVKESNRKFREKKQKKRDKM
jgi:hypothetical protein